MLRNRVLQGSTLAPRLQPAVVYLSYASAKSYSVCSFTACSMLAVVYYDFFSIYLCTFIIVFNFFFLHLSIIFPYQCVDSLFSFIDSIANRGENLVLLVDKTEDLSESVSEWRFTRVWSYNSRFAMDRAIASNGLAFDWMLYSRGSQPGVHVPPGVHLPIRRGTFEVSNRR